jgi:hypothetical protein
MEKPQHNMIRFIFRWMSSSQTSSAGVIIIIIIIITQQFRPFCLRGHVSELLKLQIKLN